MELFLYKEPLDDKQLYQGDILKGSEELKRLFLEFYPGFPGIECGYFMILTQSCDLVVRDGKDCSAPYLNLAAVCDFDDVLEQEMSKYQNHEIEKRGKLLDKGLFNMGQRFLERLFNNNEDDYFFLPEDVTKDFGDSVALLRLTMTLSAQQYYELCLKSKIIELNDTFKAKLGWIVGNIFSRVGTEDWTQSQMTEQEFVEWIKNVLNSNFAWVDKYVIKELRREKNIESLDMDEIQRIALEKKRPSKRDELVNAMERILVSNGIQDNTILKQILMSIRNDSGLSGLIKG
jgi:hypothetical protein